MIRSRRRTAWLLVGLILLFCLFSAFETALEAHHDCTGGSCRICALLAAAQRLLHTLVLAAAVLCVYALSGRFRLRLRTADGFRPLFSPVLWKVKLLN